jgi:putative SOS response-associated peptidase YedK
MIEIFELLREPELSRRYNIADVPRRSVRQAGNHHELSLIRWGPVPFWCDDPKSGPQLFYARGEMVRPIDDWLDRTGQALG